MSYKISELNGIYKCLGTGTIGDYIIKFINGSSAECIKLESRGINNEFSIYSNFKDKHGEYIDATEYEIEMLEMSIRAGKLVIPGEECEPSLKEAEFCYL